ncbi:hypothetical protein, partial [Streptomyces sp. NPDC059466]|uniref:hypothetical protein n=1 Tax=unclassified Streptomyces TaxID=2593676 RepID=UPI00367E9DB8
NTVALAMRHNITATQLRDSIYTHPSSTEALNLRQGRLLTQPSSAHDRDVQRRDRLQSRQWYVSWS